MKLSKLTDESMHEEVKVIKVEFLDSDNPQVDKPIVNSFVVEPDQLGILLEHIEAEEFEGRPLVVALTTKTMKRGDLEELPEWEP